MRSFLIMFIISLVRTAFAQSVAPSVFNSDGGTGSVPSSDGVVTVYYNIGEPIIEDVASDNGKARITQGFLQPDIIGTGVLIVYSFTTGMTCNSSNDASVVLNLAGMYAPFMYKWYKNGVQLSDTGSTLLNLGTGTYSYVVSDQKRNSRSGLYRVENGSGPCKLIIHNGLSPNSDGHNDFFHVEYIGDYPDNTVRIYNRWGDEVWHGNSYDNTSVLWKGDDAHGSALAAGTYYYIIELEGKKLSGWVELMR